MIPRRLAASILSSALAATLLAACSDKPEPTRPAASAPAAAPPAAPTPGRVSLEPRHEATLAQGIDFTKPGFPSFVREASGVSGAEPWGRWTDANVAPTARFRLDKALPKSFTLELRATGLGPNAFAPVKVRAGSVERTVVLGDPPQDAYRLQFEGVAGDTIEIVPPQPILPREASPGNPDPRKLGVGLVSIRILD
jgi:phosphoglycerol transferase